MPRQAGTACTGALGTRGGGAAHGGLVFRSWCLRELGGIPSRFGWGISVPHASHGHTHVRPRAFSRRGNRLGVSVCQTAPWPRHRCGTNRKSFSVPISPAIFLSIFRIALAQPCEIFRCCSKTLRSVSRSAKLRLDGFSVQHRYMAGKGTGAFELQLRPSQFRWRS